MDAPLRLATSEGERWAYVADALKEASERNERTAGILERLSVQLDGHDARIKTLEDAREKATEKALDALASGTGSDDASSKANMSQSLLLLANRIYTEWRTVGLVVLALYSVWTTIVGPHIGIVLR